MTDAPEKPDPPSIPLDAASAISFAAGTLDVLATVIASLTGRGLVSPDLFKADMQRLIDLWSGKGNVSRAGPPALMLEKLNTMSEHLETVAHVKPADPGARH